MQDCHKAENTKKGLPASFAVMLILFFLVIGAFFVLKWSGKACAYYYCIALDSEGEIYIGKPDAIVVYDSTGNVLRQFSPQTSRGYDFYISNDIIFLSTGTKYYEMSICGELLKEEQFTSEIKSAFYEKRYNQAYYINGKAMKIRRSEFLPDRVYVITEEGRQIYFQMPRNDYLLRLGLLSLRVIGPLFAALFIYYYFIRKKSLIEQRRQFCVLDK